MADRQVIEWDKDDIDALRFMKVDVLGLGMLGCMRRAFDLLAQHRGLRLDLATIPAEDPATYAMIRTADTLGTFQIESRAQMSMLPRLKPRTFYDIVIQVAIVRPGTDPGRHGASLSAPPRGTGTGATTRRPNCAACWKRPWACRCSRNRRCRWRSSAPGSRRARRMRCAAAWRRSSSPAACIDFQRQADRRHGGARLHARIRREDVPPDRGLRQLRFPGEPRGEFRADRLCLVLAEMPPSGRVLLRAAERAADGVLRAGADRARRAAARRGGAAGLRQRVAHGTARWSRTMARYLAVRLGLRMAKGLANVHADEIIARRGDVPYRSVEELWRRAQRAGRGAGTAGRGGCVRRAGTGRRQALWAIRGLSDTRLPLFDTCRRSRMRNRRCRCRR